MINKILMTLNRRGMRWILVPLISLMYFRRGFGLAGVRYHPEFRAWEYRVRGKVYLSPGAGWAYESGYLKDLLQTSYFLHYTPAKGDCIIDLGAGLGEETVVFAEEVGKEGKVFSIEANEVTARALEYACAQNNFTQVNVSTLAIGAEEGVVEIEDDPTMYVGNTVGRSDRGYNSFKVRAIPLDLFVAENNITRIDLLKSNIEGAEQFLIQGMEKSLGILKVAAISCHDFRFTENNESEFYATREKVIDFFKRHAFDVIIEKTGHVVNDNIVYAINRNIAHV